MSNEPDLPSIDPAMLAQVSGGASDSSDQLTLMLNQLMSSIKDLAANRNSSGNDQLMQFLPIFMMMSQRDQPHAVEAPVAAPPPPGDGWVKVSG